MRLFLDSSALIAAAASATGASRAVFRESLARDWQLLTAPYALGEVARNLSAFPAEATAMWLRLRTQLELVDDVLLLDKPVVFPIQKDRPILFSALASADVLLTLDRADFGRLLGSAFYGLDIMTPGMWLARQNAGRPANP